MTPGEHRYRWVLPWLRGALVVILCLLSLWEGAFPSDLGRWESGAPMLTVRSEVAGAVVGDRIYIVGGLTATGVTDAVEEYDPAANRWRLRARLPQPVHHPAAAALGGKLYVIGGFVVRAFIIWIATDAVYEFDPTTDRWRPRASLPTRRGALAAVSLDGKIYAVGGTDIQDTGAFEVYDAAADTWQRLRPMPTPRNHLAAAVVDGRIYVFGGRAGGVPANVGATEVYDPTTSTWQERAPLPTPRSGIGAAAVGGKIYVLGGELGRPDTYPENEEYDPAADHWASRAPMPTPRHGLAAVALQGRVYALSGGPRPGGHYSSATEIYVPPW